MNKNKLPNFSVYKFEDIQSAIEAADLENPCGLYSFALATGIPLREVTDYAIKAKLWDKDSGMTDEATIELANHFNVKLDVIKRPAKTPRGLWTWDKAWNKIKKEGNYLVSIMFNDFTGLFGITPMGGHIFNIKNGTINDWIGQEDEKGMLEEPFSRVKMILEIRQ